MLVISAGLCRFDCQLGRDVALNVCNLDLDDLSLLTFQHLESAPHSIVNGGLKVCEEVIRNDPRTWLPILFARASIAVHPTVALMENFPHFMSALGGEVARRVLALYKRNGYATLSIVIRCERFGVAQARRRLLLLAVRSSAVGSAAAA